MRRMIALLAAAATFALVGAASAALPLVTGDKGTQVCAAQWLLSGHKPSVFPNLKTYTLNDPILRGYDCQYGAKMRRATRDAYWKLGWPAWYVTGPKGGQYGPRLHAVLLGKATRPIEYRIAAGRRINRATPGLSEPVQVDEKTQTLVEAARHLIDKAPIVRYSQVRRMEIVRYKLDLPPLQREIWEDCSSATTGLYWLAGLPDPNGLNYNGFGYTGTQGTRGIVVWKPGEPLTQLRPGDLIFYGGYPYKHVSMYLGNGQVFSHGSEGGPYLLPALYRPDATNARRYPR